MSVETEEKLYQERVAIHPKSVKGAFRTFKTGVLVLAYAVFFLLPWLRWDRGDGPSQAVLFDIPGRRFYIFDLIVHPQDIYWLAGALIIFAWLLFFVTGVVGRAFCGYFCFQTLWTDAFMF
ncbi:MAG: 4Fe-4S binding protein, partial [Halothiobacillaceae bacterium]